MKPISLIIQQISNQFEWLGGNLDNPLQEWQKLSFSNLVPPPDLIQFVKHTNGMRRIAADEYFALNLFPMGQYILYSECMNLEDGETGSDYSTELQIGDDARDFIVIGLEGEYGYYILNCNSSSLHYGMIYCVIINIPERTGIWANLHQFLDGLVDYCNKYPLENYYSTYIMSEPRYRRPSSFSPTQGKIDWEQMKLDKLPHTKEYQNVILPPQEVIALLAVETLIGNPIPNRDSNYGATRFFVKDGHVHELVVVGYNLEYLPPEIGNLTFLEKITVSSCQLKYIPPTFGKLIQLRFLDLGDNELEYLPQAFDQLVNLKDLHLSRNLFRDLPVIIGTITSLEFLTFSENQITNLPSFLGKLVNLVAFNCSYNLITEFPKKLCSNWKKLRNLSIYDCQITSIPENIDKLAHLNELIISSNNLVSLPESIIKLTHLTRFNFLDNPLLLLSESQMNWLTVLRTHGCDVQGDEVKEGE